MTVEGAGLRARDAGRAAGGLSCAWAERDQNTELKPGGQSQLPKELKGNPDRKSDPYAPLSVRKAKQSNSVNRPPHPQHTHTEEKEKTLDLALRGCFFWALVKLSFWQERQLFYDSHVRKSSGRFQVGQTPVLLPLWQAFPSCLPFSRHPCLASLPYRTQRPQRTSSCLSFLFFSHNGA